jgi:hypothetical protein
VNGIAVTAFALFLAIAAALAAGCRRWARAAAAEHAEAALRTEIDRLDEREDI